MKYTRKFQSGGGFVIYTPTPTAPPAASGAAPSGAASASASSSSSILDKDIMKELTTKGGLTNDVNYLIQQLQALEQTSANPYLSSANQISSLTMISKINELRNNKSMWDDAMNTAESSGGLGEIAVGNSGELYVKDNKGEVKAVTVTDYKKYKDKYQALSVADLLNERQNNPLLIGQNNLFNVANNSIGMDKISQYAQKIVAALGKETMSSEKIYEKDAAVRDLQQIGLQIQAGKTPTSEEMKGFEILRNVANSPSKYSEVLTQSSSERNHALKAVKYIWNTLGSNAQRKLNAQAAVNDQDVSQMLLDLVVMGTDVSESSKISPISEGKAVSGSDAENLSGAKNMNNFQTMIKGTFASGTSMVFNDPEYAAKFNGLLLGQVPLTTPDEKPVGPTTLFGVLKSGYENYVDTNNIYFGNKKVSAWQLENIVTDGRSSVAHVLLPVDNNGNPDNASLELYRKVMDEYNANKENMSPGEIQRLFNNSGFQVSVKEDKTLDVRMVGSHVKPFLVTTGYTNNVVSELLDQNNDPESGGLRKLGKGENSNMRPIVDQAWIIGSGKSAKNIQPSSFWKNESLYKGLIYMPLRDNASVRVDSSFGDGPKHRPYTNEQVMYHNQNSSGFNFVGASKDDL